MRRSLNALAGVILGILSVASAGRAADDATAYQINPAHDGSIALSGGFTPPLTRAWVQNLHGSVSYPVIANGLVFVNVGNNGVRYGSHFYALRLNTGEIVWRKKIRGSYYWSATAYENGKVFVVNADGVVRAFTADDAGLVVWMRRLPCLGGTATSAPTALNGYLYVACETRGVYALREDNGHIRWNSPITVQESSPTLGDGGLYITDSGLYFKLDPTNGTTLWLDGGVDTNVGENSVYFDKHLYLRDELKGGDFVLDAGTGAIVAPAAFLQSPAFYQDADGNQYEYAVIDANLYAVSVKTGTVLWSVLAKKTDYLVTAPIVVNGLVVVGSASGKLYLLDGKTGALLWKDKVHGRFDGDSGTLTGLGAGDGMLLVPSGAILTAYTPSVPGRKR